MSVSNDYPNTKLSKQPLYYQVFEILANNITSGAISDGNYLPNEYELSQQLDVSIGTIRKAVGLLVDSGLAIRRQGKGTLVSDTRLSALRDKLDRIRIGDTALPAFWIWNELKYEVQIPPENIAKKLQLDADDTTHYIHRTRYATPGIAVDEQVWVPTKLLPSIEPDESGRRNAARLIMQHKYVIGTIEDRISPVIATSREAELIDSPIGTPLLKSIRVIFTDKGIPVEYRLAYIQPGEGYHYVEQT